MKPGFRRKYCVSCSAAKKARYEAEYIKAKKASYEAKTAPSPENQMIEAHNNAIPTKDKSIVAQCLTKVVFSSIDITPESVLETYNYFLKSL